MKITCELCKQEFISKLVGDDLKTKQLALTEISNGFASHLAIAHRKEAKELAQSVVQIQALAAWYLAMDYAEIPEDEKFVLEQLDKHEEALAKLLGLVEEETKPEVAPAPAKDPGPLVLMPPGSGD